MEKKSAEERIGEFLRFGSRLGLERMTDLMRRLGDPQDRLSVIHVAGTNGKGSTSRYIYESLIEAGYRAGIYTSPFIEKFNERIEADRELISDEDLDECTDIVLGKVADMTAEGAESPTEFEVVTAVAFVWFSRLHLDAVVLEVGLGGRGDSTNIIKAPVISVITSISYDHMDRLGSTIEEIAAEKAGIIKASCPVVVSTERGEALHVFREKAEELGAPLYDARWLSSYTIKELGPGGATFDYRMDLADPGQVSSEASEHSDNGHIGSEAPERSGAVHVSLEALKISMGGEHQVINACEALTALSVQDRFKVSEDALKRGLERARQPGRFEIMHKPFADPDGKGQAPLVPGMPWVIIDGAHNQDAAVRLKNAVKQFFPGKKVLFVCGILKDKDVSGILDEFTQIGSDFIATEPENDRKLSAYELAKAIHERGHMVYEVPRPSDAAALAMSEGPAYDVILFTGSLYLIGKIRKLLREKYLQKS